ncbi:MAG: rhomboid family intramembrane serine protease [Gemmatimonadetes bacterium]|nr:rhomboid family intramembrane serine protease [Gemmatimonadota bacterium]
MTPVVLILVLVNIAAYLLQSMVPGLGNWFAFVPAAALVRPWTVVTYMFLHGSLSHIGFNMLALYFFGPRIEDRMGSQRFATLYFASGITGALLSMLFSGAPIIGASGGVFGVMLAFAFFWPNDVILLWGIVPVPARVLVIGTTVLALFSGFSGGGDGIAHFAHLGGYAGAFLYLKWLERGRGKFRQMATSTSAPRSRIRRVRPRRLCARWKASARSTCPGCTRSTARRSPASSTRSRPKGSRRSRHRRSRSCGRSCRWTSRGGGGRRRARSSFAAAREASAAAGAAGAAPHAVGVVPGSATRRPPAAARRHLSGNAAQRCDCVRPRRNAGGARARDARSSTPIDARDAAALVIASRDLS